MRPEAAGGLAARWMLLGEWRAHPARVATAVMAIAVGVALAFAVHLINASALNEFSKALRTVNGDADLQVRSASPQGFAESAYPAAAGVEGIAAVSPGVEFAASVGAATGVTLIGLDPLRAALVTPALLSAPTGGQAAPGAEVFDPDAVRLSPAALADAGVQIGGDVVITAAGITRVFRVVGVLSAAPEGRKLAVIDIAAAQWRFGQLGRLQRLDLKLAPGADADRVSEALRRVLPVDAAISNRQTAGRRSDSLSRAYRVNLQMLGLVALLTGGFLVFSAQSLSVARRRPQFALLRVLGTPRRALMAQVLAEGAIVGVFGAGAGLAVGFGIAATALRLLGGDLGGGYFQGGRPQLVFAPVAAAVFFGLGLAAAILGALLPARAAARAEPAVALKGAGEVWGAPGRISAWTATALLCAGALATTAPAIGGVSVFGYLAIALLLAGGVTAMPWLARLMLTPLSRRDLGSAWAMLAAQRLWGAPGQGALALCGIVASTSLMIAMAVMVTSFRSSVTEWLGQILPADLYVRMDGGGGLDPQAQTRLATVPGVAHIAFRRTTSLSLSPNLPPIALIAEPLGKGRPTLPLIGRYAPPPAGVISVWASEPAARIYGLNTGVRRRLPLGPRGTLVNVAGVWRDYAHQQGAISIDIGDYERLTGEHLRTEAAVTVTPGVAPAEVARRLRAALPPASAQQTLIAEPREIRARALSVFDRSFLVTYGLEAIAILVGLTGVGATFAAQTLARAKEFGMLRHVGVRRGQVVAMLAAEGALLGAVGAVAGIALGLAMSQVLIHVVNPQSFNWTMRTQIPWVLLMGVTESLVTTSAGAAVAAGWRALSADAIRAVREDW